MKNTMSEGCDRELIVNILTPFLPFTHCLSMQKRVITYVKKKQKQQKKDRYMEKVVSRKVVLHSEDYACQLCRAEKKTRTSLHGSILKNKCRRICAYLV